MKIGKILGETMNDLKWFYYNHALLPTTAPHEEIDEAVIKQGKLWRKKWGGYHY